MSADEIITTVSEFYYLDEVVSTRLEVSYTSFIRSSGNKREVKLCEVTNVFDYYVQITRDKILDQVPITINDLKLKVRHSTGDYITRDCSYDSAYMRNYAPRWKGYERKILLGKKGNIIISGD